MQGKTQSSESIWTAFNNITTASSRQLKWLLKIAWNRVTNSGAFATVGSSIVGGSNVVKGLDAISTGPDLFNYFDETARAIRIEYDRSVEEPLGGIAKCIADFQLDNTDQRFTPNNNATIGTAILPNRPIQAAIGFFVNPVDKTVYVFKGLTKQPRENKLNRTVDITAFDYLEYLNDFALTAEFYTDQTSDEIIAAILADAGISTNQYDLDEGLNTIGFAYFEQGQTALSRIRLICEAEGAIFFQDETGIIRFENRRHNREAPHSTPVWDLDPDDVVLWEIDQTFQIINKVVITVQPRMVEASQEVWRAAEELEVAGGETKTIFAEFSDPVTAITSPVSTTDYTAFSQTAGAGSNLTSSISVVATLFTNTTKLEITNSGSDKAFVNLMKIRGTPAVVTGGFIETYEDTDSIAKYQRQQLNISNPYIDTASFAAYIAKMIVLKYKEPLSRIRIRVQGIPQLQLNDMVRLKEPDLLTYTNYRVVRIQGVLEEGLFYQDLTLREVTTSETDAWAVVGITQVGSTTEFVGI